MTGSAAGRREATVRALLARAGIAPGGPNPWDIQVHDRRFYDRLLAEGTLGAGESYMEGWWDCPALEEFMVRVFRADLPAALRRNRVALLHLLQARLLNLQDRVRARRVARRHYDLSNAFYRLWLGPSMSYTCAYWRDAADLEAAQRAKHDLVCRKLKLRPGERLLELGCGFGALARHAAEHYGCRVVAVNISAEQVAFARDWCAGLPVEVHQCDYRDPSVYNPDGRPFDKAVSVGMIEHVGPKNYRALMGLVHRQLGPEGLFLVHGIGSDRSLHACDPFTDRYIFPGSVLPSVAQLGRATEGLFVWEDLHNFGRYYEATARAWHDGFVRHWPEVQALDPGRFDAAFFRMWTFYLKAAQGMARSKDAQLWQLVLSRRGAAGLYEAER